MINNYLILLLLGLAVIAAALPAVLPTRTRLLGVTAVALGMVATILTVINWTQST